MKASRLEWVSLIVAFIALLFGIAALVFGVLLHMRAL